MTTINSLCVYCGSSNAVDAAYFDAAFALGRLLGENRIDLVYGGGHVGLMGRLADGVLDAGGRVTGIIPRHLHEREVAHDGVQEMLIVDSMHIRKALMAERADAFAVLPGGIGTLDEFFEILTWRQLGLHDKPIILIDLFDYWAPLEALMDRLCDANFASTRTRTLYQRIDRLDQLLPLLSAAPTPAHPLDAQKL